MVKDTEMIFGAHYIKQSCHFWMPMNKATSKGMQWKFVITFERKNKCTGIG